MLFRSKASGDQWANYFPKSSVQFFQQSLQGRYSGIGIWLRTNSAGILEISSVQKGSPAAEAGIKVLDQLSLVNGASMQGASVATATAALRGQAESQVQLQVVRNYQTLNFKLQRGSVLTGDVSANQLINGIVYIQVEAITASAVSDVRLRSEEHTSELQSH